jgi:hypothetical protein
MPNNDEYITIRGIPFPRAEVYLQQERLGAQPFDESLFNGYGKKIACAQVIRALDFAYNAVIQKRGYPLGEDEIMQIDIGDGAWVYIPILIVPPSSNIIVMPTEDRPAGLIAWFRRKKIYTTGGYHARKANQSRLH